MRTTPAEEHQFQRNRHTGPAVVEGSDPPTTHDKLTRLDRMTAQRAQAEREEALALIEHQGYALRWDRRRGVVRHESIATWDAHAGTAREGRWPA